MQTERDKKLDHVGNLIGREALEAWDKYDSSLRVTASVLLKRMNKDKIMDSFHNKDSVADSADKNGVSLSTVYRKLTNRTKNKIIEVIVIFLSSGLLWLEFI